MANNKTNSNKPPIRKANKNSQWRNIRDKEKLLVAKDILMFIRATLLGRIKSTYIKGPSESPLSYSSQDVSLIWDWLDRNRPLEKLLEAGEDNEHVDANGMGSCDEEHLADDNKDDNNNKDIAEGDKE